LSGDTGDHVAARRPHHVAVCHTVGGRQPARS
jgi:hypothetical protein